MQSTTHHTSHHWPYLVTNLPMQYRRNLGSSLANSSATSGVGGKNPAMGGYCPAIYQ